MRTRMRGTGPERMGGGVTVYRERRYARERGCLGGRVAGCRNAPPILLYRRIAPGTEAECE